MEEVLYLTTIGAVKGRVVESQSDRQLINPRSLWPKILEEPGLEVVIRVKR